MRLARFFAADATRAESSVALPDEEGQHLTRVLRLQAGDAIAVFNGRGQEWRATVEALERQHVRVRLHEAITPPPESSIAITLAVAALKGDKMDEVVRDAVMIGVAAIQPIVTARTEIPLARLRDGTRVERWQRVAVASAKQCGRAVVPDVSAPLGFADALPGDTPAIVLVEPSAEAHAQRLRDLAVQPRTRLFIGPEGGWTPEELRLATSAGAALVTLGAETLRADAAPLVAVTALRTQWGDL
jgi:16S rRNA (uracil1498-N3)-methyltransferase